MSNTENYMPPQEPDTPFGKFRPINDLDKHEKLFIVLTCACSLAISVLSIDKMVKTPATDKDFTFALFILVNAVFCVYYVIHGVLKERPYKLGVLGLAVFGIMIYTVLNFSFVVDDRGTAKLIRLVIVCVTGPFIIVFSVIYGWKYYCSEDFIHRNCSNNIEKQKTLLLFHDLQTLDLQLGISMLILILNSTPNVPLDDYILPPIGVVFSLVWFIIGYTSSDRENTKGMVIFFIGSHAEPAFVLYKIIKSAEQTIIELKWSSFSCGILALVIRMALIINAVFVLKNFGQDGENEHQKLVNQSTPNKQDVSLQSNTIQQQ